MASPSSSSPHLFEHKIASFCEMRLSPLIEPETFLKLKEFMVGLVQMRARPPMKSGKIDWQEVAIACRLTTEPSSEVKRRAQPGFDAIVRWLDSIGENTDTPSPSVRVQPGAGVREWERPIKVKAEALRQRAKPGPKPQPIKEFPNPLFEHWEEPVSFQAALDLHMRRFGESYYHLHRAVVRLNELLDQKTILSWLKGTKVPRSVQSLEILSRIERRYQLPEGYFKSKFPHQARSAYGHELCNDISPAERQRIAWHLPDDFNSLPFAKREEILDWVRRVIINGATDYRMFQAAASKQRYAIRFPAMTYGKRSDVQSLNATLAQFCSAPPDIEDPDLLSVVIDVPPRLAMEMADLMSFKTSTLTVIGFQRNGVWGEETALQKLEHLGLIFGALAASPDGEVAGCGIKLHALTFGLLLFPAVWDWYLEWRERRRGFFTSWESDMLSVALSLTREETGWLRQHPELANCLVPISGLVTSEEIAFAKRDWHACCDTFYKYARNRSKEINRVMRVHRDPFEPIMCVLEAPSPLAEYRKITEEILIRMPDQRRYPRAAAESIRSFLMLRLGLHLGLRQKNLRQLLVCPRGHLPTSERRLEQLNRGEIRWSDRDRGWEVLIPAKAFKNAHSSFFGSKPFRLILPNLHELYHHIESYIESHRPVLLAKAQDPGTFFVKTVKNDQ
ncbi:hypothetical protein EV217_4873 [Phyllobacterium myrsinacearum]|nr:hypothetical protein EV217_4873 [Phyllobacterium myrsinacearum]